ncbi:MAG: pyridoxamine 5'-phosphate oxidase family protein [Winogradskyella sp.]|uniref:pyridoxamine 5'-phosphate oxidase family protein n=1 Tax=Winogradskyella sp. TaxID=1883156 RepID=UPI000F418A83|nr:pyridoxamine 5'-phosphate oxidase family protein [Winogradskyella sp.]RNC86377.1 MAG: pyridoxamine 5'-phosphate oxidase family protein [Winogradskyella sp.]
MELTKDIREYIDRSILCWLATASENGVPNVSPKEIFSYYKSDKIIIANIASPQSLQNINVNNNICLSFIDILIQKGFQIKGTARIVRNNDSEFSLMESILTKITLGKFPFTSITEITMESVKPIVAPRYILYPETTEDEQIKSAKKAYGF